MDRTAPSELAPSAPDGSLGATLRAIERLFELTAIVGVVLYLVGFATSQVDMAIGVALGVSGALGNLACGFCRAVTVESG